MGGLGGFSEAKTLPKTGQVSARRGQVGARTSSGRSKMAPRLSKDVLRSIQDSFRFENFEIYKNIEKPVAVLFIDKGEEFEEGEWSPFCGSGRLADFYF